MRLYCPAFGAEQRFSDVADENGVSRKALIHSRKSMAQTSLGPCKFVLDVGSSRH